MTLQTLRNSRPKEASFGPPNDGVRGITKGAVRRIAEREGFEPPEPCGSTVFKTASFDRSDTSPFV
jgi:hypothetical protein